VPPRRLVLLRHGRTAWNAARRFQGQTDIPLDETGRAQAAAVAPYLAELGLDAIVSSDLSRAAETAAAVAAVLGLPVRTDARLRESDLGPWEGLTAPEAAERLPAEYAIWRAGGHRPSTETREHLADRAVPAIVSLEAVAVLVVTHGGTARAITGRLLGLPVDTWTLVGPLGNCRWSVLRAARGHWQLVGHNAGVEVVPEEEGPYAHDLEPAGG
jgi:broad specificity phosphatase PhoE